MEMASSGRGDIAKELPSPIFSKLKWARLCMFCMWGPLKDEIAGSQRREEQAKRGHD